MTEPERIVLVNPDDDKVNVADAKAIAATYNCEVTLSRFVPLGSVLVLDPTTIGFMPPLDKG